jgi:hypothetical protein
MPPIGDGEPQERHIGGDQITVRVASPKLSRGGPPEAPCPKVTSLGICLPCQVMAAELRLACTLAYRR